MTRSYWLDLFTGTTWKEFMEAGANVSGFGERHWNTLQKVNVGDYLLCYLTGISRFIGALEVVSKPFRDSTPIWKDQELPCRVRVKVVVALTYETSVPVLELRDRLSFFRNLKGPHAWSGQVRGSLSEWKEPDGDTVVEALKGAQRNPIARPFDAAKLARRPRAWMTRIGPVTVPTEEKVGEVIEEAEEATEHTRVQWLLLKLGDDMGLDLWVARNDRGREVDGHKFTELTRLKKELPVKLDEATKRIVEMIDVLWLSHNNIVAAFEIERKTQIYSGLLRLSDLIALMPNTKIPLYIVAPDIRRDKVLTEVNRPTFSILSPPLSETCRFMSFSALQEYLKTVASATRHLKPSFLEDLSETCVVEEG